ncbi:Cupredoxin-like domain-containing protein [Breoghania corrubedonensis]|uniref:Cupredoxin-like domain-containing protein n=1 Tax=Breoghania corrubedonensis TaxID=665038 RepID=A0A2T5VAZ1_9HYPH|nr:cupredoxin domain-containing protein [Breoghania corrubedonensis]PTW60920.1 Cupredoxin-like domain-containing protein [Breoghania corrubedonensis]
MTHSLHLLRSAVSGLLAALIGIAVPGVVPASADEMKTYDMELKDGVITPQTLEVEAGTTFKIIVRNTGTTPAEFESLRLRKEKVLGPGVTSFVVIRRLSSGTYKFYDEFHMDQESANGVIIAK